MQSFFRKYSTEICYFLAPVISLLLIKYIAGIHFLDYIFLSNYDTTIELSYLKLYVSGITNHIFDDPLMGAPLVSDQNYWPWRNIGIGTYYFIISLFEKDIFQIYQIFYYSLFPILALSMFVSLRHFIKLPNLISLGLSLIYPFMPFMFSHNIQHATVLAGTILVPLVLGMLFHINFKDLKSYKISEIFKSKTFIASSIIIFGSVTMSLFSAFYSGVLLVFILLRQFICSERDYNRIILISLLIAVNLLAILFNVLPHLAFKSQSHFIFDFMSRNFVHTTLYSVSIIDFFIPIKNHVFDSFKFYNQLYSQGTLIREFFNISYLGIFGISSFIVSIIFFFKRNKSESIFPKKIAFIGALLIFLILIFVRGGLLTTFYLYTDLLVLGSNYRITPWVLCLSLISGGLILDYLYNKSMRSNFLVKEFTKPYLKGISFLILISIVSFSLLDFRGTRPYFNKKDIPKKDQRYEDEKNFYTKLNQVISDEDMILQIPYVCFQETKDIYGTNYRNLWSYLLINKEARFSAMSLVEGTACSINSQLSSLSDDVMKMIKYSTYYGYTGLILEKRGFIDQGNSVASQLKEKFNLTPLIDSTYLYYDITVVKSEFPKIKITPIESDALNEILIKKDSFISRSEIQEISQIFPSPCVDEEGTIALQGLDEFGKFNSDNCDGRSLYNKDFFHFVDDRILPFPTINTDNGMIKVKSQYIGPILSVHLSSHIDAGIYEVIPKDNNGKILDIDSLSIDATHWGNSFSVKNKLKFELVNNVKGTRLKPIVIVVRKDIQLLNDINLKSITIRRIQGEN